MEEVTMDTLIIGSGLAGAVAAFHSHLSTSGLKQSFERRVYAR
jgi:succinate dehydrogenase/fumarate reductase flavoprotein subunit